VAAVCLSYVEGRRPGEVRYLVRRLRRRFPDALLVTGLWGLSAESRAKELDAAAGGDRLATTLRQAMELCIAAARGDEEAAPTVTPLAEQGRSTAA
jgi:hypothetical protein